MHPATPYSRPHSQHLHFSQQFSGSIPQASPLIKDCQRYIWYSCLILLYLVYQRLGFPPFSIFLKFTHLFPFKVSHYWSDSYDNMSALGIQPYGQYEQTNSSFPRSNLPCFLKHLQLQELYCPLDLSTSSSLAIYKSLGLYTFFSLLPNTCSLLSSD